jgi:hypothetical protein
MTDRPEAGSRRAFSVTAHIFDLYKGVRRSTSYLYAATITFRRQIDISSDSPMDRSEWDFHSTLGEEDHVKRLETPAERVDRFGILTACFVLCLALFIAALWLRLPSFEKCSALDNVTARNACYEKLRSDLSKPPAKGPDIPKL